MSTESNQKPAAGTDAEIATKAAIRRAIGSVLFNVSNFPERAQSKLWGANMGPLNEKITEAVLKAVGRNSGDLRMLAALPEQGEPSLSIEAGAVRDLQTICAAAQCSRPGVTRVLSSALSRPEEPNAENGTPRDYQAYELTVDMLEDLLVTAGVSASEHGIAIRKTAGALVYKIGRRLAAAMSGTVGQEGENR